MAAFGKVLDLLNDRYLSLQDVTGNVEPLPTLVPYEEYSQNVIVYRMDTNHDIFMGLIQDFTMRHAQEAGKEVWTWCAQWEVENRDLSQAPTPKKPRLDTASADPHPQRRRHATTIFERRTLDPELMKEEDMLRILIDIVQTDSSLVPNFIEFLYRWIDFYEGDGKALKAALKWEIPSLWDFEYHPLVLADKQKPDTKGKAGNEKPTNNKKAEELAQSSPTKKMREKPDLAAMERRMEESERLQYREVRYGIQPPKLEQPIPPLINIPQDTRKRQKYYAACFKSRQRAFVLLVEAGITPRQIANYKKLQSEHPKETPQDEGGNGMRHYNKDARYAQGEFELKEKQMLLRAKQREISISSNLALEASLATRDAVAEGASGVPLIPRTPAYDRRPDMAAAMMKRIIAVKGAGEERIKFVPAPLVGRLQSRLFEGARAMELQSGRPNWNLGDNQGEEDSEDEDTDMDDDFDSDSDDDEDGGGDPINPMQLRSPSSTTSVPHAISLLPPLQPPYTTTPSNNSALQQQHVSAHASPSALGASNLQSTGVPANIAEYMRNLTPEQAQSLLPLLSQGVRQTIANGSGQVPAFGNAGRPALPSQIGPRPQPLGFAPPVQIMGAGQPGLSMMMPFVAASPHRPSTTALTPQTLGSQSQSQFNSGITPHMPILSSQSQFMPPRPYPLPLPGQPVLYGTVQGPSNAPLTGFPSFTSAPGILQPLAPQQSLSTPQLLSSFRTSLYQPPRPSATLNMQGPPPSHAQQASGQNVTAQSIRPPNSSPAVLQTPAPRFTFNVEEFLALRRQQTASAQAHPSASSHTALPTSIQQPPRPTQLPVPGGLQLLSRPPLSMTGPPHTQSSLPQFIQPSLLHLPPSSPQHQHFSPPQPGIQRNAPSPLNLIPPPPSPLSSLGPSILATSPFAVSPHGIPIQIYFPRIVIPGRKQGTNAAPPTDALLLGHTYPGSGKITLSKAIFLPTSVWTNTLRRVRVGAYTVLETYSRPNSLCSLSSTPSAHHAVYTKLAHAYSLLLSCDRENDLTKRWRCTRGPMTGWDRGAVWEGWAAVLERGIEMVGEERRGAVVSLGVVDEGVGREGGDDDEEERRRREVDELMDFSDEDDGMEE
ncbi:hypothetical protein P153DRAFT_398652 [Dothidotthia symphoricarpi CBS 119687]|uniref:Uncharacterized protein n=1 Tax=Dothidotthia symphoricarpi CBS 119687 TaxID=1392245 RepID=A0A6A6A897_9PLEO|nr:uncharacterized protein P153DRAFT_398652 [Dothidotthia symphoricarpi CBS 119687]KAF2127304.1 hypothetical protein P153DRAFT_398652 [Dothidotthia symphoricarpi CBS 119687]